MGRRGDATAATLARARTWVEGAADRRLDRRWLAPLLSLFVFKQLLLVAIIGPFTGHDEVDHFWYVARLARGEGLGEVGRVKLPPEAEPFKEYVADYPNNAEVIQPPLYHALLAPVWRLVPGDVWDKLFVLRLISVGLGVAVVWLAYLTARLLFPHDLLMRAGVPSFVALQPQFSFEAAIVNHDVLVIFLFSLVVLLLLTGLRDGFSPRREWTIGLLIAAGLWTKLSFGLVMPAVVLAVGLAWLDRWRRWGDRVASLHWLLGSLFLTVGLPLLLLAPWLVRSYVLYGDPTGASRLRAIGDFGASASTYRGMLLSSRFWEERLADFWSNYGWRHIPFEPGFNHVLWLGWGILLTVSLVALMLEVLSVWLPIRPALDRFQQRGLGLLALSVLSLGYGVLYVGTIQFTQSRFIFPAMIGIAALTLTGLDRVLSVRWRPVALTILVGLLTLVNVVSAIRFLIPFYYGPGGGGAFRP